MPRRRCPFCHEMISVLNFERHIQQHTELRSDGQMTDHVTLPPEQRESGSLEGVPSVYEHSRCGQCTQMPDEIIRSYLKNPFLYNNYTFCAGCGTYFHTREFTWIDTGETLYDYNQGLKAEYRRHHPSLWSKLVKAISGLFQGESKTPPSRPTRKRRRNEELDDLDELEEVEDIDELEDYEDPIPKRRPPKRDT